jgi:preprotein translocase subunit SecF
LLPVLSLLIVGSWILGAVALREFALALFVGLLAGSYSSIFIASPVLAIVKEREKSYRAIRARIERQTAGDGPKSRAGLADEAGEVITDSPVSVGARAPRPASVGRPSVRSAAASAPLDLGHEPRPRKKKRR